MPALPASLLNIVGYDFQDVRISMPGIGTACLKGVQGISGLGVSVESSLVRGLGSMPFGTTTGNITPNVVTIEMLFSAWNILSNTEFLPGLMKGASTIDFHFNLFKLGKAPPISFSIFEARFMSYDLSIAKGPDPIVVTTTWQPMYVGSLQDYSALLASG